MTEVGEVYFCEICGNKVKVLEAGVGTLVCCGEPMKLVKDQVYQSIFQELITRSLKSTLKDIKA